MRKPPLSVTCRADARPANASVMPQFRRVGRRDSGLTEVGEPGPPPVAWPSSRDDRSLSDRGRRPGRLGASRHWAGSGRWAGSHRLAGSGRLGAPLHSAESDRSGASRRSVGSGHLGGRRAVHPRAVWASHPPAGWGVHLPAGWAGRPGAAFPYDHRHGPARPRLPTAARRPPRRRTSGSISRVDAYSVSFDRSATGTRLSWAGSPCTLAGSDYSWPWDTPVEGL
jgi:hypothetical protein